MIDDIKNELNAMAEADYRDFQRSLFPKPLFRFSACACLP